MLFQPWGKEFDGKEHAFADGYVPERDVSHELARQRFGTRYERMLKGVDANSPEDVFYLLLNSYKFDGPQFESVYGFDMGKFRLVGSRKRRDAFRVLKEEAMRDRAQENYRGLVFAYEYGDGYECLDETHVHPEVLKLIRQHIIYDYHHPMGSFETLDIATVSPERPGATGGRIYAVRLNRKKLPSHIHLDEYIGERRTRELLEKTGFVIKPDEEYGNREGFIDAAKILVNLVRDSAAPYRAKQIHDLRRQGLSGIYLCPITYPPMKKI